LHEVYYIYSWAAHQKIKHELRVVGMMDQKPAQVLLLLLLLLPT
jgi:hypothetical protein